MSISLPNFRTLKEGDYVSAREWNAIVAFIKGMSRSGMTDGIMDSTGFHPRRKLSTSAGVDPVIILRGPDGSPPPTHTPNITIYQKWSYWLSSFPDTFDVDTTQYEIILKKQGYYEFHGRFCFWITYDSVFSPVGSSALIYVYDNSLWTTFFTSLIATNRGDGAITTGYSMSNEIHMAGSTGGFFKANARIKISCRLDGPAGTTFIGYSPAHQLQIKYCGDITPVSPQDTPAWKVFGSRPLV
jgi:hypothetical protein